MLQEEVAYGNHLDRQISSPQALSFARRESMKAYSQDVRERVLRAVDLGRERRRGGAAVWRLAGYHQALPLHNDARKGICGPKRFLVVLPRNGPRWRPTCCPNDRRTMMPALPQHRAMWEQTHGERVRSFPMSRAMKRLGWTRKKKSLGATERNEEERAAWRENASKLPTEALVFLDECGSNIALTPLSARAPKGERARGSVPRNRGQNTALIAALSLEGMGAAMILEGSTNTTAFELDIE